MIQTFLNEGQVGQIATSAQKQARQAICERWDRLGFTKGLNGYMKDNMATLFENEAAFLIKEATNAQSSGSFETVVFPLVRRVFSRLLLNDIVSVQAMNMPIGKLFFILPVTSERTWNEAGTEASHKGLMGYERKDRNNNGEPHNRYYLPDEVVNVDASGKTPEVVHYMKKSLYDLFYNDGLFDQSKGKIHIKTATLLPVVLKDNGEWDTAITSFHTHEDGSIRNIVLRVGGFSEYNAGKLTGPDGNEMDTEAFLASMKVITTTAIGNSSTAETFSTFAQNERVEARCVTQRYGYALADRKSTVDGKGYIYIELDLSKPCNGTFDGYKGVNPDDITVASISGTSSPFMVSWAEYDSLELETEIGEVSFELTDVVVSVEERKLRATWSPELSQDVAAFHNIDAEAELTAILSEQVAAEIDREGLRDLRFLAPWKLRWDYNGWRRTGVVSTNYTQKDWNQTFMTKINQISAQIHKATLRGGANFVVVSTEISAVLNDLEYFHVTDANAEAVNYSMGIEKIGSLNGRYTVYVDPYSPAASCIIGHKGDSLLDTGYIYAPYVPMQLTPVIYNPFNFAPVRGIMTRYAKKMVNNRYYGGVVVSGLQTWDINELR